MMAPAGIAYRGRMNAQLDPLVAPARARSLSKTLSRLARGLCWVLWLGLGSSAQAKTCEEARDDIAQGMDAAGLRGYSLQIVPAGTPLAGAKVVGNCAGGSRKIVYRRFALRQAQPLVSEAPLPPSPEPAPSPAAAAPEPKPEPKPKPVAQLPRPQPAPPAPVATRPVAPEPAPAAVAVSLPEPASPMPVTQAEPAPPPPAPEPVAVEKAVTAEAAPASQANDTQPASASLAPEFLTRHWAWLGLLLALPLLAWLWRWRGGGVDAAGLPRGPRL